MRGPASLGALISWALLAGLPATATAQSAGNAAAGAASAAPASAPAPASAAASSGSVIERDAAAEATNDLLRQAQFLRDKYRPDLARPILLKVLAVQPYEPRALLALGDIALRDNKLDEARSMLEALEQQRPGTQETRDMQSLWRLYTIDRNRLEQLRQLHRGGREPEAAALARELFLAGLPPASLYEEFGNLYGRRSTTGAAPGRRGSTGPSRPWVETNPAVLARQRGYAALTARDHTRAEAEFAAALKRRPRDSSTLAGMGILRLRQGQFAESARYFDRAIANERGNTSDWREQARTARYWDQVGQARTALAQQQTDVAQRLLESARTLQPFETEATLLLADLYRQRGELDRASALYEEVLRRDPADQRAVGESLGMSLSEVRTPADIDAVLDRAEAQAKRLGVPFGSLIDVGALRDAAEGLVRRGESAAAQRVLERGVAAVPTDPWLRYDLARLYQREGQPQRATALMDDGLAQAALQARAETPARMPGQPAPPLNVNDQEMRQAAALIALGNDREDEALRLLGNVDPTTATEAQRGVLERARFEAALRRYRAGLANADTGAMSAALAEAATLTGGLPERRLRVAAGQLEAGQRAAAQAALASMDPAALPREDAIRWAQIAIDADRMEAAGAVLARLAAAPSTPAAADLAFQDSLIGTQARWTQRRIDQALAAGRPDEARQLAANGLAPWTRLQPVPRTARLAQAELLLSAQQPGDALPWLDELLLAQPDDTALRLMRVRALDAAGRPADARAEMQTLIAQHPTDADVRLEASRLSRADGDYNQAMAHLQAVRTVPAATGVQAPATGVASAAATTAARTDVSDAIATIEERRQPRVEMGLYNAQRSARAGVDELHHTEASILVTWPVGYNGQVFGQLDEVKLDAGTLPTAFDTVEDFGKIRALGGGADLAQPVPQSARGRNVAIGWTDDKRRVDLGVIGLNMPVQNVVGGWLERFSGQGNDYSIDVSRRPMTSSLLTYAGTRDPITGEVWGGVTQTGLTLRLGRDLPQGWSLGSSLRVAKLTGKNVESNTAVIFRTAVDRDWYRSEPLTFNAGVVGNIWHFARNSNYASFGQGNYYSPQRYVSIGIPLQISGRIDMWSYLLRGSIAHSWTHEDGAPYYPTSAALQALGNPLYAGGGQGGGFGTSLRGAIERQLTPQWVVGASFDIDRSTSYSPNRASIYLRHFFKPQAPALSVPPNPVTPYSQY
ncbi:hypothetical protein BH09PSE5_BH09PSE5_42800 [soil metagenome]